MRLRRNIAILFIFSLFSVANLNGGDWQKSNVDRRTIFWSFPGIVGTYNDIKVDSKGNIHVCYSYEDDYNNNNREFRYAVWKDTFWDIEVVVPAGYKRVNNCSMALDSNDSPHIVFNQDSDELKYAKKIGATWDI